MSATQPAKMANGKAVEELDVLVVGAGFAGLCQLDRLRRLGYHVGIRGRVRHWRRLVLELLSGRPGRFVRAALSVLQRGTLAGLELQRALSLVGGASRLFPPRRQEARSEP